MVSAHFLPVEYTTRVRLATLRTGFLQSRCDQSAKRAHGLCSIARDLWFELALPVEKHDSQQDKKHAESNAGWVRKDDPSSRVPLCPQGHEIADVRALLKLASKSMCGPLAESLR